MGRDRRGQASVEFALIVPLVLVLLLAIVQVALVAYTHVMAIHVAREVARSVALQPDQDLGELAGSISLPGTNGVVATIHFEPTRIRDRDLVVVTLAYRPTAVVGLFQPILTEYEVSTRVVMAVEV